MGENGAIHWTNERRKLRDLVPWDHNPREINKREAERLGESLQEFGQIQTIAIGPDNEVYDGHQRKLVWSVLPQFGPDHVVDVRVSSRPLTDRERQKLVVCLHRGTMGQWDWDELANSFELGDLLDWGFDEGELVGDWGEEPAADPGAQVDRAAELQEKWQVRRGDVWQVGRHRVMCGDSTSAEDVGRLMGGERATLVFTDPPYGVDYDGGTKEREKLQGDANTALYGPACEMSRDFSDEKAALYLWHAGVKGIAAAAAAAAAAAGYEIRCEIVWNKNQAQFGALSAQYKQKHEPCYYCFRRGQAPRWFGPTNEVTVWDCDRAPANEHHPTQKPPDLAVRAIWNSSELEQVVADWFLGSGSTIVACEQTNRIGYGMEIEPKYVAVTLERLAGMGLEPQRVSTATLENESA